LVRSNFAFDIAKSPSNGGAPLRAKILFPVSPL
jgi:hypothetical protein